MAALFRSLALAALVAAYPGVALAAPPVTATVVFDDTVTLAAGSPRNPCQFDVEFRNQGALITTTHLDASGTPVRQFARGSHIVETFSANGKSLSSRSTSVGHIDLATNTSVVTGNQRHFVVPGVGLVLAQAGRMVVDLTNETVISSTGLDVADAEQICSALAP